MRERLTRSRLPFPQMFQMVEVLGYPPRRFIEIAPKRTKCFVHQRDGQFVCVSSTNRVNLAEGSERFSFRNQRHPSLHFSFKTQKLKTPGSRTLRRLMCIDFGGPFRSDVPSKNRAQDNGTLAEMEQVSVVDVGINFS